MKDLIDRIKKETPESFDYEWLGDFVRSIKVDQLQYRDQLPEITNPNSYARNILLLEPFECALLYWPPEVESAVHHHDGFWGYVLCLEGQIDNIEYEHRDNELRETKALRALRHGVVNEPDGTIHKIVNSSETDHLITLHFYYPALEDMDGMVLYDTENCRLGVLNEKAGAASFEEPKSHFKKLEEDAFRFLPYKNTRDARSHRIYPVIPKPTADKIGEMINGYYAEQALKYDSFDLKHESRRRYIEKINDLIAEELRTKEKLEVLLDLAGGTGRRALKIKEMSGRDYSISGVDLSEKMCSIARERGIDATACNWLESDLKKASVDAITFLYAFGHLANSGQRQQAIEKMSDVLKPGGFLFMDVFNANDRNEWGPEALRFFDREELHRFGYERGDVFYKKTDGSEIAFLHYSEESEVCEMLERNNFEIDYVKHIGYVYRSGEELSRPDEGALFIKAIKK